LASRDTIDTIVNVDVRLDNGVPLSGSATGPAVVLTGASSGIGRAAAAELVRRGCRVIAVARREDRLQSLRNEVGDELTPLRADITDPSDLERFREQTLGATGGRGPETLINNAGIALDGLVESTTDEVAKRQFETNFFALLAVTRAFLPELRAHSRGRIVNVGSVAGRVSLPTAGVYSASKYAVEGLSDALRAELRPFGVHVVLVEPLFARTALFEATTTAPAPSDYEPLMRGVESARRRNVENGADPQLVARVIARAALARRPRRRYLAPGRARLLVPFLTSVPTAVRDRIMSRFTGFGTSF
jgi:short-subunit dehydrogenase